MKFIKYWIPLFIYAGIIFYVSSMSNPPGDLTIPFSDKVIHAIEYAIFAYLMSRALKGSGKEKIKTLAILLTVMYAISDEVHQIFVPGRECSIFDLAADTVGGFIGVLIYGKHNSI